MVLLEQLNSRQSILLRNINDVREHVNNNSQFAMSLSNSSIVVYNLTVNYRLTIMRYDEIIMRYEIIVNML